jgi:hypothetical protein
MVTINYEALGQLHLFESGVLNPKRISAQGFQNAAGISPLVMGSEHY